MQEDTLEDLRSKLHALMKEVFFEEVDDMPAKSDPITREKWQMYVHLQKSINKILPEGSRVTTIIILNYSDKSAQGMFFHQFVFDKQNLIEVTGSIVCNPKAEIVHFLRIEEL